ncbi:DUF3575 domain-containing protein [Bacteroides xylanisolvens]|nr:DUF3575 domain-containing protein [Bacteroides xylanisolvens]
MLWCTCARTTGGCKDKCIGLADRRSNVEAEFVLGSHVSLNMGIAANPISTDNFKTTFTHFQPEVRYLAKSSDGESFSWNHRFRE